MVAQEKLVERLTALQLKDGVMHQELEKESAHVDFKESTPVYREGSQTVSISAAEQWEKELLEDAKNRYESFCCALRVIQVSKGLYRLILELTCGNRLALSALLSNPLPSIISQKVATLSDRQTFNIRVPLEGSPVTNQRSSGRCWLFASTNVFRVAIMKKHNLREFELSQAYLFFWDKLEKANYFLEQIIDTSEEELESRLVQELLKAPVNDGGQWDMVANLVAKYGLVCPHP
jgi:bleomycin hydrolase